MHCYFCFKLPTLKMAGDVIASVLLGLNVHGAIMASLLFDATEF